MNKLLTTSIVLALSLFNFIYAQYDTHASKSFHYPRVMNELEYSSQFVLSLAHLPEDYVEEVNDLVYAPNFQYAAKLGFRYGLALNGSLTTNIITYNFQLGPSWSYKFRRFSVQVGYDVAFTYGKLKRFGFDNEVFMWMNYPSISIGLALNTFTAFFKTELVILTSAEQFTNEIKQTSDYNLYNGISFLLLIEQPFWKDNYLSLGVKANYLRLYYPVWLVFPTWDRFSFIPEFVIGFKL